MEVAPAEQVAAEAPYTVDTIQRSVCGWRLISDFEKCKGSSHNISKDLLKPKVGKWCSGTFQLGARNLTIEWQNKLSPFPTRS